MKEVAAEQQNIRLCTMQHSLGVHGTAYASCAPRQPRIRAAWQRRANFRSRAQRPKHVHTLAAVAFVRTSSTARKLSSRRGSYSAFCSGCISTRERRLSHARTCGSTEARGGSSSSSRAAGAHLCKAEVVVCRYKHPKCVGVRRRWRRPPGTHLRSHRRERQQILGLPRRDFWIQSSSVKTIRFLSMDSILFLVLFLRWWASHVADTRQAKPKRESIQARG